MALFVLLGVSLGVTDTLNRSDFGRGIHAFGGALWVTFPLFFLFGAGAFALAAWVVYSRRKLFGFVVAIGLLPTLAGIAGVIWFICRAFQ